MLETIREYALERFADDPAATRVRRRLLDWCLGFAREATPHLQAADRVAWVARLDGELPNLLAALSWALEAGFSDEALELAATSGRTGGRPDGRTRGFRGPTPSWSSRPARPHARKPGHCSPVLA